ncbi:hypothetical protein [Acetobacter indonesiensis]
MADMETGTSEIDRLRAALALEKDREAIRHFGHGLKPIQAISHLLTPR